VSLYCLYIAFYSCFLSFYVSACVTNKPHHNCDYSTVNSSRAKQKTWRWTRHRREKNDSELVTENSLWRVHRVTSSLVTAHCTAHHRSRDPSTTGSESSMYWSWVVTWKKKKRMAVTMGVAFPQEWELDLNKDGNGNTTTWEWEWLMLVGCQYPSRGSAKSHYGTLCDLCLWLSHKSVIYFCLL